MFFLLFIIIPLIEVILFITIGKHIGLLNTIIIILITGIIGAFLVKNQGITILNKAAEEIKLNKIPIFSIFEGIAVFVAGAFLLTPGFFTDCIGFAVFLKPVQSFISLKAKNYFQSRRRY